MTLTPEPTGTVTPDRERIPMEIWVLFASAVCVAVGFGFIGPVLPRFAKSFDVSDFEATMVISAFALFRLVGAPVGGFAINRVGERRTWITGVAIVAVSSTACAWASSYEELVLYRALGGVGSAMFTVSSMQLLVRLAPAAIRGRVSSVYASSWLIGGITGPVIGGALASQLGMRIPFIVYGAMLSLALLLVVLLLSEERLRPVEVHGSKPPMPLSEALSDTAYRAALFAGFANGWATFGVRVALLPLLMVQVVGDDRAAWWTGVVLMVFAASNGLMLTQSGRIADTIGRKPPLIAGFLVMGVATALMGPFESLPALLVLSAVGGLGAGLCNPAQQAAVADIIGRDRSGGRVLPLFSMVADLGTILVPIGGLISDRYGYGPSFVAAGLLTVVAAGVWLTARETLPSRQVAATP